jgi:uncharacterized protein
MKKYMISQEQLNSLADLRKVAHATVAKLLRKKTPNDLDHTVHAWNEEIFESIDCLECGNCCRNMQRRLTSLDVKRLSKFFSMKTTAFTEKYLKLDEDEDYVFKTKLCPFFQDDNTCLVYEARPRACSSYPHMDSTKFYKLINVSLRNIGTCPAVFHVFERLAEKYGRKFKS